MPSRQIFFFFFSRRFFNDSPTRFFFLVFFFLEVLACLILHYTYCPLIWWSKENKNGISCCGNHSIISQLISQKYNMQNLYRFNHVFKCQNMLMYWQRKIIFLLSLLIALLHVWEFHNEIEYSWIGQTS